MGNSLSICVKSHIFVPKQQTDLELFIINIKTMKKVFTLLTAIACSSSMMATRLFLVGDATPMGWNIGTSEMQNTELIETAPGVFTWTGKLVVGDEGFKVSESLGNWGGWRPAVNGTLIDGSEDTLRDDVDDFKWKVSEDGIYTVTIDWEAKKISAVKETYELAKEGDYYMLGTAEDLFYFSQWLSHGVIDNHSKAKLTADIDFSAEKYKYAVIGCSEYEDAKGCFSGEFDGQGHTITVAIKDLRDRTGLFAFVRDATIKNLIVDGIVTSTDRNCLGGLGGRVDGSVSVENVIVKTAIKYSGANGDATCGGLFANMEGNSKLTNCAFLGSIDTGSAEGNGGLVGWAGSSSNNIYTNCLVAPTSYTMNGNSADFARNNPTLINCHRVDADDARFATGELCYELNEKKSGGEDWYQTLGTDATPVPFNTHSKVFANGTFKCDGVTPKGGDVVFSNTNQSIVDEHVFENSLCKECKAVGLEPSSADGVYQIANIGELIWFAAAVNNGNSAAKATVTADINQADAKFTPIGSVFNPYNGTFDGACHTVTLNIDADADYQGLFGVLTGGAEISNLTVAGSVKGNRSVGGIAGGTNGNGDVKFTCVGNEATVEGTNNAGGILGVDMNSAAKIYMTNVYNAGSIKGAKENGGLSGWAGDGPYIKNAYCIGSVENGNSFIRCNGSANFSNTYGPDDISENMLASGELCAKLADKNFRQTIGEGHPVFDMSMPGVYDVTVGADGYATYVAPATVDLAPLNTGDNATYTVTQVDNYAHLGSASSVAEGEAIIVKAAEGTYYINSCTDADTDDNLLVAATEAITADGSQYVLANKDGVIGFYKATGTIAAGKGYLVVSGAGIKAFYGLGAENATAISGVNANDADAAIYNIAGQRMEKMQKGINIVGGKKFLK